MRFGEYAAVNLRNIVADDVHRITEQVNRTTGHYARLEHRKNGEYRDVPLPAHRQGHDPVVRRQTRNRRRPPAAPPPGLKERPSTKEKPST